MKRLRTRGVRHRVTVLLAQIRPDVAARDLRGDERLEGDLGLDSLATAVLAVRLHEEFAIDLVALAGRRAEIATVDDLVRVVESLGHAR